MINTESWSFFTSKLDVFSVTPVPSSYWIITISIWKFPAFLLQTVIDRTRVAWTAWGFECRVLAPPPGDVPPFLH